MFHIQTTPASCSRHTFCSKDLKIIEMLAFLLGPVRCRHCVSDSVLKNLYIDTEQLDDPVTHLYA